MIVLHAAPLLWGRHSGPNASVPGLAQSQNRLEGVRTALLTTLRNPEPPMPTSISCHPGDAVDSVLHGTGCQPAPAQGQIGDPPHVGERFGLDVPVFARTDLVEAAGLMALPSPWNWPDLAVFHSTYIPFHARLAANLTTLGIPYVICPRGGMTRGALGRKWLKKRVGDLLFFRRLVSGAAAIHCLTEREAQDALRWQRPVFVAGNGVLLPPGSHVASPGERERLRLTFMGRLDIEHKGLDLLLEACRLARPELVRAGAQVELYGPAWQGSVRSLRAQISRSGLEGVASVADAVSGAAKTELLRDSDVFLHTSRWEGHPMAVLEALAHGVPCLLTPETNVADEVTAAGAGWRVEASPVAIAEGLRKVLGLDRRQLAWAGRDARRLVEQRYTWDHIAVRTAKEYRRFAPPSNAAPAVAQRGQIPRAA